MPVPVVDTMVMLLADDEVNGDSSIFGDSFLFVGRSLITEPVSYLRGHKGTGFPGSANAGMTVLKMAWAYENRFHTG